MAQSVAPAPLSDCVSRSPEVLRAYEQVLLLRERRSRHDEYKAVDSWAAVAAFRSRSLKRA